MYESPYPGLLKGIREVLILEYKHSEVNTKVYNQNQLWLPDFLQPTL